MCQHVSDVNVGQNTYFHHNHPLRWVRLVGVIVALDVYPNRVVMTLDDSSGLTIDIFCRKGTDNAPVTNTTVDSHGTIRSNRELKRSEDEHIYTTNEGYKVNLTDIDIGSVVKVKGGISEFRGEKQITLERICAVFLLRFSYLTANASAYSPRTYHQ